LSETISVVGVARNCGKTLRSDVTRLMHAASRFANKRFFIVESDSSDDTPVQLRSLQSAIPGFAYSSLGNLQPRISLRTERIAFCRNHYLDALRSDPAYCDSDFVIVADLDGINNRVKAGTLDSCWNSPLSWSAMFANRVGRYYDIFALRCKGWCDANCFESYSELQKRMTDKLARYAAVESKMIRIPPEHAPIQVESAFGGLAVYRREAILEGRYSGVQDNGMEVCEHVSLNTALAALGHMMYINPSMVAGGVREFPGKDHLRSLKRLGR
jgi:hypothetical protein